MVEHGYQDMKKMRNRRASCCQLMQAQQPKEHGTKDTANMPNGHTAAETRGPVRFMSAINKNRIRVHGAAMRS